MRLRYSHPERPEWFFYVQKLETMSNKTENDYEPFGEEWKKEVNKLPKALIINMLSEKGRELDEAKKQIGQTTIDGIFYCKSCLQPIALNRVKK